MATKEQKLSIIIPTKNRPSRLKQSLQYYIKKRFKGTLLIVDASTGRNIKVVDDLIIQAREAGLNIQIGHYGRHKHYGEAIKLAAAYVETPYVMYCRDDDTAIPRALIKCIEFLDMNPNYIAASGPRGTWVRKGNYNLVQYTRCLEVETDYITDRLSLYLRTRLCTTHYVHRIEVWREMFKYATLMPNKWLGGEVLPCCISVMSGRIKDVLTNSSYHAMIRSHGPDSHVQNLNFLNVLHSEDYIKSARVLRRVVLKYLVDGGLDSETAGGFYDREMWLSTLILLMNKFVERYPNLKPLIDEYSQRLDNYPFEWKFDSYPSSCVTDPSINTLLKGELYYGKSNPLKPQFCSRSS